MGCDIYVHSEVKINGTWHHYNKIEIHRDYELFSFLAGVRGEVQAFPVKGFPEDASLVTKIDNDRKVGSTHTHSWINVEEIAAVIKKFPNLFEIGFSMPFIFGNTYPGFLDYREDFPPEIEDVRWVFWFVG